MKEKEFKRYCWEILNKAWGHKGYVLAADLARFLRDKIERSRAHPVWRIFQGEGLLLIYKKNNGRVAYVKKGKGSDFEQAIPGFIKV